MSGFTAAPNPAGLIATASLSIPVSVDLFQVTAAGTAGPLLARQIDDPIVYMNDELTGAPTSSSSPVWVIASAAMPITMSGRSNSPVAVPASAAAAGLTPAGFSNNLVLGGDRNGLVIGPAGSSGVVTATVAWKVSGPGPLSPTSTVVGGFAYDKTFVGSSVPVMSGAGVRPGNSIAINGIVTISTNRVYGDVSAAAATAAKAAATAATTPPTPLPTISKTVEIRADGWIGSTFLGSATFSATVPGAAFPNLLIGPFAPTPAAIPTYNNPAPGKVIWSFPGAVFKVNGANDMGVTGFPRSLK